MVDAGQRYKARETGIVVEVLSRVNDHAFIQYPNGSARSIGIVQLLSNYELIEEENVTEFKPGDKVRYKTGKRVLEVIAQHGGEVWLKAQGIDYAHHLELAPDFFEVGKTYHDPNCSGTFDVHHVGHIGAPEDNRRYATGQFNRNSGSDCFPIVRERFAAWTEV